MFLVLLTIYAVQMMFRLLMYLFMLPFLAVGKVFSYVCSGFEMEKPSA